MRKPPMPKRIHPKTQALLASRARDMRCCPTESEEMLWRQLRGVRLGVSFRRQVPIARFIVDFLAPAKLLVVEIDGRYHQRRRQADARRDAALARFGYRVLRLEAELVRRDVERAASLVREALARPP